MASWLASVVGRVLGVFIENGTDRTRDDARQWPASAGHRGRAAVASADPAASDAPDVRELQWQARTREMRLRTASPDWRNPNDTPPLDEHLRQDIGLRDTRARRSRLPWD